MEYLKKQRRDANSTGRGYRTARREERRARRHHERSRKCSRRYQNSSPRPYKRSLSVSAHPTIGTTSTLPTAPGAQGSPGGAFSYAAVTRQHLPVSHVANVARNNEKRRQFTFHPIDQEGDMGLGKLTDVEIIEKLKLASETTTEEKEVAPQGIRFSSVRRMKKSDVSFELNSDDAASWLRDPDTQQDFTGQQQGYQFCVLAEFVPISFDTEATYAIQTVTAQNSLRPGHHSLQFTCSFTGSLANTILTRSHLCTLPFQSAPAYIYHDYPTPHCNRYSYTTLSSRCFFVGLGSSSIALHLRFRLIFSSPPRIQSLVSPVACLLKHVSET